MKKVLFLMAFVLLALTGCEKLNPNNLFLINQSNYEVTISLDLGKTNEDGSIIFETHTVPANSEKTVQTSDNYILVEYYEPSDKVDMDFNELKREIVFTNNE